MQFSIDKTISILERTAPTLQVLLEGLPEEWTNNNEGDETWSPYDIIGHLIHGERTDWTERMHIILSKGNDKAFKPFDRFAQFEESKGKTLSELLEEFKTLRNKNLEFLLAKNITEQDLSKTGIHPAFGEVSLSELLATWAVHDLDHIAQIARVMGKQYKEEVGPWTAYLRILNM